MISHIHISGRGAGNKDTRADSICKSQIQDLFKDGVFAPNKSQKHKFSESVHQRSDQRCANSPPPPIPTDCTYLNMLDHHRQTSNIPLSNDQKQAQLFIQENSEIYTLNKEKMLTNFIPYYGKSIKNLKKINSAQWGSKNNIKLKKFGFREITINQEADIIYGIFYLKPGKSLFRPKYLNDSPEHYLILSGSCQIQMGQICDRYQQGDLVNIPSNVVHTVFTNAENPKQEVVVGYSYSVLKPNLECQDLKYSKTKRMSMSQPILDLCGVEDKNGLHGFSRGTGRAIQCLGGYEFQSSRRKRMRGKTIGEFNRSSRSVGRNDSEMYNIETRRASLLV